MLNYRSYLLKENLLFTPVHNEVQYGIDGIGHFSFIHQNDYINSICIRINPRVYINRARMFSFKYWKSRRLSLYIGTLF